ncbi:ATP-grasp domain-containing protein [Streptomyces platensis]|uniref:ATP-grasp domain-containing protein n=1 Tax=Streptomyces platensis TaxID=58346 RepID=UPI002ED0E7DE|nr:ATP-grasp domain-containing protein [Streptomyces platensis]
MAIAAIETLNFGLGRLVEAARTRGQELYLLTVHRGFYQHELAQEYASEVEIVDVETLNVEKVVTALKEIPDLQGIIRATDLWSSVCLEAAERLQLPHQNTEAVRLIRDKGRLRRHLYERGLTRSSSVVFDPHTTEANELAQRLSFPSVVKNVAGSSSQNVWLVKTEKDLAPTLEAARQVHGLSALTAEPYFFGPLYSVETLTWAGETRVLGVTSRTLSPEPYFREETFSFPVAFPEATAEELAAWVSGILEATEYREGFTHTEFIITADGFELVEINPRLGGGKLGEMMSQAYGINVYDAFFDLALGQRPALMDVHLEPRCGTAQVKLYAPEAGTFEGIDGQELLSLHPGAPALHPTRGAGDHVPATVDGRGVVASLIATGETTEIAYHNVLSMAGKLHVRMRPAARA